MLICTTLVCVDRYMDLIAAELGYFIEQAVKGLVSFGFSDADAQFDRRCAPGEPIIPASAGRQLQTICVAPDWPLSANNTCSVHGGITAPAVANAALVGNFTKDANGQTSLNIPSIASSATPTPTSGSSGLDVDMAGIVLTLFSSWVIASMDL
jgi:hypothetical protein